MHYKTQEIQELMERETRSAPFEVQLREIQAAEQLAGELDAEKEYRYAELHRRITAQHPDRFAERLIEGEAALHDLRLFVEDLSESIELSAEQMTEPVLTLQDLSDRYGVSTKTVDRWRDRGLISRRFKIGNRTRVGFLQSSVDRFVSAHAEEVRRGSRFSQMTDGERAEIVETARDLVHAGGSPASVVGRLAKKYGRSTETIRYTLKNHDQEHRGAAILRNGSSPLTDEMKEAIYRRSRRGASLERLAKDYQRTPTTIRRVVNEIRAKRLWDRRIEYVYNAEFEAADAENTILGPAPEPPKTKGSPRPPAGLPRYLASLYEVPLLTKEQEAYYFRKMNYLKFKAEKLRDRFDPERVKARDLDRIETLLGEAADVKNLLIRRNLRLVVSIAKKYARAGTNFFEMVSDGNVSLMRAIDKFDYSRGFKLSTYATWAIRKNFARSIPAEHVQLDRFRTGYDEMFHDSAHEGSSQFEQERTNARQREALMDILKQLNERERDILVVRYGLGEGAESQTLEQVGHRFGVSKERIRQLEARALRKLREIAVNEKLDIPGV